MANADAKRKRRKKRRQNPSRIRQLSEFTAVYLLYVVTLLIPMVVLSGMARVAGNLAFIVLGRRRRIALENVRNALGSKVGRWRAIDIARKSFQSFLLALPELIKRRRILISAEARQWLLEKHPHLQPIFDRAREIHEQSGGCIFVTPHLGNWELLPYVSTAFDIPTAIAVRPLDNPYLERFVYKSRTDSGQLFMPNRNSLVTLQQCLDQGRSVGLLPDQSTKRGLLVEYFGRPAYTTPIPATLALIQKRPIVVIACCRVGRLQFTGFLGEPIWPRKTDDEHSEIMRLTRAMNRQMEEIVLQYPEQYFWMHNRWKQYHHKSRRERKNVAAQAPESGA